VKPRLVDRIRPGEIVTPGDDADLPVLSQPVQGSRERQVLVQGCYVVSDADIATGQGPLQLGVELIREFREGLARLAGGEFSLNRLYGRVSRAGLGGSR
jgi:hypothetical protein